MQMTRYHNDNKHKPYNSESFPSSSSSDPEGIRDNPYTNNRFTKNKQYNSKNKRKRYKTINTDPKLQIKILHQICFDDIPPTRVSFFFFFFFFCGIRFYGVDDETGPMNGDVGGCDKRSHDELSA